MSYWCTGLLHFAGCTAESEIDARFFGDELAARPRMLAVAHGSRLELIAQSGVVGERLRAVEGDVFSPQDPYYPVRAGKKPSNAKRSIGRPVMYSITMYVTPSDVRP